MDGDPVIPAPLDDDDDDVAWGLQTAAIQWQRGQRADAVVWLRRAVDSAISAGNPARTQDLTRLAASVADRLIAEALAAPDSVAPAPRSAPPVDGSEVDALLATDSQLPPPPRHRASAHSLTGDIPVDFDDGVDDAEFDDAELDDAADDAADDDDVPTIPPAAPHFVASFHETAGEEELEVTRDVLLGAPPGVHIQEAETESAVSVHPSNGAPSELPASTLIVAGISLDGVRGFEDLPEPSQFELARRAVLTELSADEEVGAFGAALVTSGRVGIMPSVADVAATVAVVGEIVFTRGTLPESVPLRVVALEDGTVVASWTPDDLASSMTDCPWVADELRLVADRFQALAGAVLGLLGERLDEALRELVLSRLEVKAYEPGEVIVTAGKAVPGLHIVGAGRVEVALADSAPEEVSPGEFLFAAEVLSAGKARASARAGKTGALVLFASRSVAHELMMSVPPLLEILAG